MTTYVFLDFDGVLHPFFPEPHLSEEDRAFFSYRGRWEQWLLEHPDVRVVISSSWRESHDLAALRAFFSTELRDRIVGTTPVLETVEEGGTRQQEIQAWMRQHAQPEDAWVALDDHAWGFEADGVLVLAANGFFDQEAWSLTQACANPAAWVLSHPVPACGRWDETDRR